MTGVGTELASHSQTLYGRNQQHELRQGRVRGSRTFAEDYSRKASASPQGCSTFSVSRSSARVRPRFTAATSFPSRAAACAKRNPEYTINEDPTISIPSAWRSASNAAPTRPLGTFSPKNTTSGLSTPPQDRHGGTTKE